MPPTDKPSPLTPPEVADVLRSVELRAGYIIGARKDVREMRLEAEEIKRLLDVALKGLRAWWHAPQAESAPSAGGCTKCDRLTKFEDCREPGCPAIATPSSARATEEELRIADIYASAGKAYPGDQENAGILARCVLRLAANSATSAINWLNGAQVDAEGRLILTRDYIVRCLSSEGGGEHA